MIWNNDLIISFEAVCKSDARVIWTLERLQQYKKYIKHYYTFIENVNKRHDDIFNLVLVVHNLLLHILTM